MSQVGLIQSDGVLIRRGNWDRDTHTGKTMKRHREKTATQKLRKETSEETEPATTVVSDFLPPELWENKLLFKPLRLWYSTLLWQP